MDHPVMKAWRDFALADPDDCDKEWAAYLALVNKKETASGFSPKNSTSPLHHRVPAAAETASSTTRSTVPLCVPSGATSTSTSDSRPATKDDLSPEARRIYDYIVGNSTSYLPSSTQASTTEVKASSTTSSTAPLPVRRSTVPISNPTPIYSRAVSATPAPAASVVSTVLPDPTAVSVAPIAADINGTDLAASVPITCSSECPSHDDAASVSILISSAKQVSSTTIGDTHSEPATPMVDDKALDVDAMGDATLMATVCLPAGHDHSINGEDPVDMSLTTWSVSPSFNAPSEDLPSPLSAPMGVPELFMWSPSTCSTDCPGSSIMMFSACPTTRTSPSCLLPLASSADVTAVQLHDMMFALNSSATQTSADCSGRRIDKPPSLLAEAYQVFNVVPASTEIVPWPPPSCTRAGTSLSYEHDLCHNAQQKRGREFLVVEVMGPPPIPPVQDVKYNPGKQSSNWLEVTENRHQIEGIEVVRLQLTWISSLRVCLNPPTAAANSAIVKNMHCKRLSDPDESVRAASRCSMVVYAPRLEDGQQSASADMLQSHKLYFTGRGESSWEGAMLVGQHRILLRCKHSDWNSFDIELVLAGYCQARDGSFFTRLLIQRAYELMPWKIPWSFSLPLYICSCHEVSVQSSTTTIMPAEKFDFQLGLYFSSDQLVSGNTPLLGSQIFGLHLHWTCFQPTIYPSKFSASEVCSLVHAQREGWFQFCPAGKASLYSYGTVQFQWEIAWPPTKFAYSIYYDIGLESRKKFRKFVWLLMGSYWASSESGRSKMVTFGKSVPPLKQLMLNVYHTCPPGTPIEVGLLKDILVQDWVICLKGHIIQYGFELARWKIACSFFWEHIDCGNHSRHFIPAATLTYPMWYFSWDPAIWALLCFFGVFAQAGAKGEIMFEAPTYCYYHYIAIFLDQSTSTSSTLCKSTSTTPTTSATVTTMTRTIEDCHVPWDPGVGHGIGLWSSRILWRGIVSDLSTWAGWWAATWAMVC